MRLLYHPFSGSPLFNVWTADKFRAFFCEGIWLYDPFTGKKRTQTLVMADPYGHGITVPEYELGAGYVEQLEKFFNFAGELVLARSKEIENHQMRGYFRVTPMYLGTDVKERYDCVVIANITIQPHLRGKGLYDRLLGYAQVLAGPERALMIQNVLDPVQWPLYERRGFSFFEVEGVRSFYKVPKLLARQKEAERTLAVGVVCDLGVRP